MDFIIDFFRGIDGWIYYTMLAVNTILIFAIIGYLGEKKNEELLKLSMNMGASDLKSGTMNLNPGNVNPSTTAASIPKVAATQVNNVPSNNVVQTPTNQVTSPVVNPGVNSSNAIPINQVATPINTPINNEIDPNEKAPAVLVINSPTSNKDVK